MNDRDTRRYDMFKRVQTFGIDNAADFAVGSVAKQGFAVIDQIVPGLEQARAKQVGNGNTSMETLLNEVKLDLQNISRTATAIEQTELGFADKFSPPKAYNPAALLTTADAFLVQLAIQPADSAATQAAKTALVAKFVAHELEANFVADLQSDRNAITNLQAQLASNSEGRVGSTASINPLIQQGMKAVNTLDAIMHNKYGSHPEKMAAWLSASHIERDPKKAKSTTTTPPVTPQ